MGDGHGDQIGRIFAHWVTHYYGKFCKTYRSSTIIRATYFHGKRYVLNFRKNGLGYILVDFFIKASGHPGDKMDIF
jgi:hypothetical protein